MPNFVEIGPSIVEILLFFDFSRWRPPPFSNSQNFICWRCPEGLVASRCQISSKSVDPLPMYCDFAIFLF